MSLFRHLLSQLSAIAALLGSAARAEGAEPGTLAAALETWVQTGGDLGKVLQPFDDAEVKTRADAKAVVAALEKLRAKPDHGGKQAFTSPVHRLTALFQQADGAVAIGVLRREGLPLLRLWVRDALDKPADDDSDRADDEMFILKVLAMYGQEEDVKLVAEATRKPLTDGFLWSVIFNVFGDGHPHGSALVDALRDPLPTGFRRVAYLDLNTSLALAGTLKNHAFDGEAGAEALEAYLRGTDPDQFSYAKSATAALPFLSAERRARLLPIAEQHSDGSIRLESAWVRAATGDETGVRKLAEHCRNPLTSDVAQQYLKELKREDAIPDVAKDENFRAVAAMARWLEHPQEFGRLPDKIELFDTRELFWPPTGDKRRLWLVKYLYKGKDGEKDDVGIGMVGSVTFALFGESTGDLKPEDVYALHCCWELEVRRDKRAPEKRTAAAGRKLLAEKNQGF